jgi:MFS superfamily sulfate permease-like transporter
MTRFLVSFFVALLVGVGIGLYLGWVQFPVQFIDSAASSLAQTHKDDYTLMIAAGYAADEDLDGAIERLRVLGIQDVPSYVQATTERLISNSRGVEEIRLLVNLAEGMGRLTPMMEPYRQVTLPGGS